jgi:hypothetical protein
MYHHLVMHVALGDLPGVPVWGYPKNTAMNNTGMTFLDMDLVEMCY